MLLSVMPQNPRLMAQRSNSFLTETGSGLASQPVPNRSLDYKGQRKSKMEKVGTLEQLKSASPLKAKVGGKAILVFLVDDRPIATQARCPHAQGPLHEAEVCD